jgi:hypothetical protein
MVPLMLILDVLVVVSSLAAFLAIRDYQIRRGLLYPPGPRPLPLIGNLFDIPKEFSWLSYTRYSRKYGMSNSLSWGTSDRTDDRGYFVIPCLWPSHRRVKLYQINQGSS